MQTTITELERVDQFAISYLILITMTSTYGDWQKLVCLRYKDFIDTSFSTYILAKAFHAIVLYLDEDITVDILQYQQFLDTFRRQCVQEDEQKCLIHLDAWRKLVQSLVIEVRLMFV
jgi:hypothetical protein